MVRLYALEPDLVFHDKSERELPQADRVPYLSNIGPVGNDMLACYEMAQPLQST
jgi:hypothetical protein